MLNLLIGITIIIITLPLYTLAGNYGHFAKSRTELFQTEGVKKLSLIAPQNLSGQIRFQSAAGVQASVTIEYEGRAADAAEFQHFMDLVDIDIAKRGERTIVEVTSEDNAPWEGTDKSILLNMSFTLPEKLSIGVEGRFYSIEILGPFQGLEIDNDYGEIYAHHITGPVDIRTSFKNVTLGDVEGEVNVLNNSGSIEAFNIDCGPNKCRFETTLGKVKLENINGGVEAITSYKPIILKRIDAGEGKISATNNYGEIQIADIRGTLEVSTNFSRIDGQNMNLSPGSSMITGGYAKIELDRISLDNSDLFINNNFSDVRAVFEGKTSARFVLSTDEGGKIHSKGIPLKPVSITRNSFEGIVGDGKSDIEIHVRGIGNIEVLSGPGMSD